MYAVFKIRLVFKFTGAVYWKPFSHALQVWLEEKGNTVMADHKEHAHTYVLCCTPVASNLFMHEAVFAEGYSPMEFRIDWTESGCSVNTAICVRFFYAEVGLIYWYTYAVRM